MILGLGKASFQQWFHLLLLELLSSRTFLASWYAALVYDRYIAYKIGQDQYGYDGVDFDVSSSSRQPHLYYLYIYHH